MFTTEFYFLDNRCFGGGDRQVQRTLGKSLQFGLSNHCRAAMHAAGATSRCCETNMNARLLLSACRLFRDFGTQYYLTASKVVRRSL